ncbi:glycosyltransferase [uncultured Tateyamaria sp.]|uniref:glycosyltransferase n=1 Tax=uncultured Tateyamaria sp. TaxID=455651 RepID=UPI0026096DC3|nr:glycosyltransferase [uncultured Tateyamaria sp.]
MSDPLLRLSSPQPVIRQRRPAVPVGRQLVNAGLISQTTLLDALTQQRSLDAPLGEILVAEGHVDPDDVLAALALQHEADRVDLSINPPNSLMAEAIPAQICQRFGIVPWRWIGDALLVATARPDQMNMLRQALDRAPWEVLPVIAPIAQIHEQITALHGDDLAQQAAFKVPEDISCRTWGPKPGQRRGITATVVACILLLCLIVAPAWFVTILFAWGILTLMMSAGLKLLAVLARLVHSMPAHPEPKRRWLPERLPRVSVMVPLFKEERIAEALIKRLSRLSYPKALLDVVLVLEAKDTVTRATLARTELPRWMRVIEVPDDGTITTKPRALNYALDFCQGDIIGVWDAEDAPEIDQIETVVAHFSAADPEVVCLQGMLDYYNSRHNWLARCFTIEYASWWRLQLPGVSQLGLVLPLGGTTLFFRRSVLEELGGWDAHNVTEDADLGLRLARRGYRTELIPTVTYEEANCRAWPWVKQRSRWLKGFFITYCVHMRKPTELLRDLGFLKFMGVQAMFLATVSQFAALPLLWTFWLPAFGLPHPVVTTLGEAVVWPLATLFVAAELLNILIGMLAVSGRAHRHLMPWVLTLPLYFPLGALASYKAIYELVFAPFYWDKTQHGTASGDIVAPLGPD